MDQLTSQNPTSIREMFGGISEKYDLANSVLSFGIHHRWKKVLVRKSRVQQSQRVLDCATGTGDLAFLFESAMKGTGEVVGSDFCEPMLAVAKEKALKRNSKCQFECADVMNLPYVSGTFDRASISFGIRNVKDPRQALMELGRVVKPKGRVLVLEFGQPESSWMRALFEFYSTRVLPLLGGWISGKPQAYKYLQTSSAAFPCGKEFLEIAQSTQLFSEVSYQTFQFGIAYLYVLERRS